MKRLILSLAAVAGLATALPAAAQGFGPNGWGNRFNDDRIEMRINRGIRDGSLTRREARMLRIQLRDARQVERAYLRDGRVSPREARDLDRRYAALNLRLRWERNDGENRNVGARDYYGRGGYYGR
jgi:hypothetical protein